MLDRFLLSKLIDEIKTTYGGKTIKSVCYDQYNMLMRFYDEVPSLVVSSHPEFYGISQYSGDDVPGVSGRWQNLELADIQIEGLQLVDITCSRVDRIAYFRTDGDVDVVSCFFGKQSNIMITKGGLIMWSIPRKIRYGVKFVEPQRIVLPSILEFGADRIHKLISESEQKPVYRTLSAKVADISPETARFALECIGKDPYIKGVELTDWEIEALSNILFSYVREYNNGASKLWVIRGSVTKRPYITPLQPSDNVSQIECIEQSPMKALLRYHIALKGFLDRAAIEKRAQHKVEARRRAIERQIARIQKDLDEAREHKLMRLKGDVIMSNMHKIRKGESVFKTVNPANGSEIVVELSPKLTPYENAVEYYNRAKKLEKALKKIPTEMNRLIRELENLPSISDIRSFSTSELEEIVGLKREGESAPRKKTPGVHILKIALDSGATVFIGRDARSNDYLTFRVAKGNDIWFHAEGRRGSHAVLRTGAGREYTREEMITTAKLAAYFSKGRQDSKVEVTYTRVKYVRKTKVEGKVVFSHNKSLMVKPASIDELGLKAELV